MAERRTPFYDYHLRHAGSLVKGGGDYLFPLAYTSGADEHVNTRTNVGMQDISSMGEVDVKGPGAERLLNRLVVADLRGLEPGQVRYTSMCNEAGGIVDDTTIYKFHDEHFMVVTSSGPRKKVVRWIADHGQGTSTYVTDLSAAVALAVVQGPRAREFLRTVVEDAELDGLRFFRFTPATINGTELLLSRSGYTGELGYELYTPAEEAGALWEYLLKQGKPFGLQPYGLLAMQSLRIEKAFPLYGNDLHEEVTPFHAGLDRWIAFDKREFIGRAALLRVQETGITRRYRQLPRQEAERRRGG
jgi:aminomethyltransferase